MGNNSNLSTDRRDAGWKSRFGLLGGRAGLDQSRGNSTCLTNFASYLTQALQIINFEICASRCIGAWIYNVHGASVCWKWCWISGGSNFWGGARRGQQRWRVRNSGGGAIQRNLPNYILVSEIEGKESVRYCWIVVDGTIQRNKVIMRNAGWE